MPKTILIVDDDEGIRALLAETFEQLGYDVETASNAGDAIDLIHKKDYPVIITDLIMPGKRSGMDIVSEAKTKSFETEVIMVTGHSSISSAVKAMKLGAYDYITKPIDLEELHMKIERIFATKDLVKVLQDKDESLQAVEEIARSTVRRLELLLTQRNDRINSAVEQIKRILETTPADSTNRNLIERLQKELSSGFNDR